MFKKMIFKNIGRVDYMKNLPFDVLSNIVSCTHGDPDYVKKNNSEALKRIHNKYRNFKTGIKREHRKFGSYSFAIVKYYTMREGLAFNNINKIET
jgi:hypothetical protein